MTDYRYQFAHGTPKRICPNCGHKRLRTYVDTSTGEEMPTEFGVCDRIESCGYFNAPKMDGTKSEPTQRIVTPAPKRTDWRCPQEIVAMTKNHAGNVFAHWLVGLLGSAAQESLRAYRVGTYPPSERMPHLSGAMVYWQIGADGLERSGKVIPYDSTGHRIKEHGAVWIHSILYNKSMSELGIGQVLFGEHLLGAYPDSVVGLVEAEKSAIIARCFHPDMVWVSTGGSDSLTIERCMCLAGRKVVVFPDAGNYEKWNEKMTDIEPMLSGMVMWDHLEAAGAPAGTDVADLLISTMSAVDIPRFDVVTEPEEVAKEEVVHSSPVDRILHRSAVSLLVNELRLDLSNVSVKPYDQ
ncbi:MAG TPA: DUF6371 domain-containing protein [Flavobacteriales bacterium]|nr:DUF6371 domain-containing protein [Flavobacteriales bacterium]